MHQVAEEYLEAVKPADIRPATKRMIAFLTQLADERDITDADRERLVTRLNDHDAIEKPYIYPFDEASQAIRWMLKRPMRPGKVPDRIKAMPREPKPERPQNSASAAMRRDPATLLHHGVFRLNDEIYIIVPTKTKGRHIAMRMVKTPERLTTSGETVKFDYVAAPGVIWALEEKHRLPVDDIEAMLIEHRVCIYPGCFRKLKAANSVRAGAGKRHCERLGIPWRRTK